MTIFDDATRQRLEQEAKGKLVELVHEIYESPSYPVVVHVFKGKTKEEAQGYFDAHLKTDKFFAQCEKKGKFGDIKCRTKTYWR